MKLFFILGRNPLLSRAEVLTFFRSRNRKFREVLCDGNILIVDVPDDERILVDDFGGVIKIGQVLVDGSSDEVVKYLEDHEVIPSDKFSYAVFGNGDAEVLKDKFKSEKKKAFQKFGKKGLKLQNGSVVNLPRTDYAVLFHEVKDTFYLGLVTQEYDASALEERDMKKPVRRQELAISPRLAKILLNLSGAKRGLHVLDPFCGIGGIVQEAVLKGYRCFGSDKDASAIDGARKNLEWAIKKYKLSSSYTLQVLDAGNVPDMQFDAIATETPLGVLLTRKPHEEQARRIIQQFEGFIVPILQRLKKCKRTRARIAITFPFLLDQSVDVHRVASRANLKVVDGPYREFRPDQFVSREIVVFE